MSPRVPVGVRRTGFRALAASGAFVAAWTSAAAAQPARQGATSVFDHGRHARLSCVECHGNGRATTTADRSWCAGCHHVDVTIAQCDDCHVLSEITPEPRRALVTFDLSVAEPVTRSVVFDHSNHMELECSECHSGGGPGMAARTECTACHVRHHEPGVVCTSCHAEPRVTAHTPEVHLQLAGCGAAGCHVTRGIDFERLSRERSLCLACHVAQQDHEPGSDCMECHILGTSRPPERRDR